MRGGSERRRVKDVRRRSSWVPLAGLGCFRRADLVVGVRVSSAVMVRRLVAEVPAVPIHVALVLLEPVQHVGVLPAAITVDLQ